MLAAATTPRVLTDYVEGDYQQHQTLGQYDTGGFPYAKDDNPRAARHRTRVLAFETEVIK